MDEYTSEGGTHIGGCSISTKNYFYHAKFKERDVVYITDDAENGRMLATTIKTVQFKIKKNNLSPNFLYTDVLNELFGESDVLNYSEAIAIVNNYYSIAKQQAQSKINNICDLS